MVDIQYVPERDRIEIEFDGESFFELITLMREANFKFDKDNKLYYTKSAIKVRNVLQEIFSLDDCVDIDRNTKKYIDQNSGGFETEFVRRKLVRKKMIVPPKKGKHPNEDYQIDDVRKGISQNRMYLAHQMGLGKSWILINIVNQLYEVDDKVLVVCPTEGVYNFRREILKFSNLFNYEDIAIANTDYRKPFEDKNKVVIMTYRTFLMLCDDYHKEKYPKAHKKSKTKKYRKPVIPLDSWGKRRFIILDEAHNIKNKTARQTHMLQLHKQYFYFRYLASGTPTPQGVEDYWSQITFMDDKVIENEFHPWLRTVATLGTNYSRFAVVSYMPEKVKIFLREIKPLIVKRLSDDHIELPPLEIKRIYTQMSKLQRKIYFLFINSVVTVLKKEAIYEKKGKTIIKTGEQLVPRELIQKFPYLAQVLDNPCLLKTGKISRSETNLVKLLRKWKFEDHPQLEIVDSLLEKHQEEKIILWSWHPLTINQLAIYYEKFNPLIIHGDVEIPKRFKNSSEYRDWVIETFKKSSDYNLLIASQKVLRTSINLTECTVNIFFDLIIF